MRLHRFTLFVFFTALMAGAQGQASFVPGYMVNAKGDTLRGEVKVNSKKEHENHSRVTFKDANGVQKNYKPEKTKAYGYAENHYVSIPDGDEFAFYKRLTTGPVYLLKSAFEVINKNVTSYDFEYFLYKTGDKKLTPVKESKFRKQLHDWMSDNPEIASAYEGEKFNLEAAIGVINQYNAWKNTN